MWPTNHVWWLAETGFNVSSGRKNEASAYGLNYTIISITGNMAALRGTVMFEELKWKWYELQRLRRLLWPEESAKLLIRTVGGFWLWRHGVRREVRVKLWRKSPGWYCIDLAHLRHKRGVEAKGGFRKYYTGDIVRDQALIDRGWKIIRISTAEMKADPKGVRKRVRHFFR